jgi:nucleoside-diphosphate-sugar epimerase
VARRPSEDVEVDVWHAADLREPSAIGRLVRESEASHLLHLAWTTADGSFWSDPANLAWASATCGLVEAFAERGGARAVLAGSCAQYDWNADGAASEHATPRRPATLYGHAKQATSDLLEAWSAQVGLSFVTGLLFVPFGPHDKPERLVPSVARSLLAGEEAAVSTGTQVRDFVYVEDCGSALAALVDSAATGAINIGSGRGASVAEVATTVASILGREDLLRIGARPADDPDTAIVADITRLRDEVGFEPQYDLETGIRTTIEWLRAGAVSAPGAGSRRARP